MFSCALLIRSNLALKRQRIQPSVNVQRARKDDVEHLNRARDQQVLVMLFTQVIVYVISVIPLMVIYTYTAVTFNISNKPVERITIERFAAFLAEAMIYLFPSSSFCLYTMSSRTFRNELIRLLRSALSCNRLININHIEPITKPATLRRVGGHLSTSIQA